MHNISSIIEKQIESFLEEKIFTLEKKENGYIFEAFIGHYISKIGKELKNKKISFVSLFDLGFFEQVDKSNLNKNLINEYKDLTINSPSPQFLNENIPHQKQRDILLKIYNKLDLKGNWLKQSINISILNILSQMNEFGIDKKLISQEINQIANEIDTPTDILAKYIKEGFWFDDKIVEKLQNKDLDFELLAKINNNNKIHFNFIQMNDQLNININVPKKLKL